VESLPEKEKLVGMKEFAHRGENSPMAKFIKEVDKSQDFMQVFVVE
jgi:hypothetical protein